MSQVMYAEAEAVTRPAFRELLREAAKDRLRERFGEEITTLAQLAVDELLNGMQASFEIEARIQQEGEERRPPKERLRELFAARRARGESRPAQGEKRERATSGRRKGRR
jgi:phage terminase small subunit